MRISIKQKSGQIGIESTAPQTEVKQQSADYNIKQLSGKLTINTQASKVEISYKAARADLGFKNYKDYSKEIVKQAHKIAFQAIAKYARQGDQLARIEAGGKPLITQAKQNAYDKKKEIGLKWKRGPKYKVTSGKQKIKFTPKDLDGVKLNSKEHWPQIRSEWGNVDIYQRKKPQFEINLIDKKA
ncbi:DUF6470 family protein [Sporohalobacter salinus]|uniref:DUF6470 family protein n=1 Tax=Sporohalobacter salinus TaxID=1494606 RepID=UPI00195FA031|nr:DUF6470 family protein [Sporohalobacter salinus]MBM7623032.1 hypothetical protein [Sporohalobacter salinus]